MGGITNLNRPLGSATVALPVANTANLSTEAVLNIGTSQRLGALNINATGVATVTQGGNPYYHRGLKVIDTQVLNIIPGGQLDLTNNALVVRGGSLAAVTALIQSGLNLANNGYWNGPGITSSSARNDPLEVTAVGVLDNSMIGVDMFPYDANYVGRPEGVPLVGTEILVKYTYFGDCDLNGVVDDGTDYNQLLAGMAGGGEGWLYGDFDYSGGPADPNIDFGQYLHGLLNQGGPLVNQGAGGGQGAATAAVPEPGTLGALLTGALLLSGLRRRTRGHVLLYTAAHGVL